MADLTKEQVEQLQKDLDASKAKIAELEKAGGGDGGNADAAKARKTIDDLKAKNEEQAKALKAHEDAEADRKKAQLTEAERLKAEKDEAVAKAKAAEDALGKAQRENAFKVAALKAGCSNVDDAVKLADLSAFDPANAEGSKTFVEEFKKGKPYLFGEGGMANVGTKGGDPDPTKTGKDQEQKQKLEEAAKKGDSLAALNAMTPAKKS